MADWTPKKRGQLIRRLRPWCYATTPDSEPCLSIQLSQVNEHGDVMRAITRFGYPNPWPVDIETLASQIIEFIQEDADGQGGHCAYLLRPLFGAGFVAGDESAKITTHGRKEDEPDLNAAPSEGPTSIGRQAQDMRHSENLIRMYLDNNNKLTERLFAENTSLRTRAEADDARRLSFFSKMEEVATKAWQIKKEERAEEFIRENIREVRDLVKPILPGLVNKAAGKKLLPEPDMQEFFLDQFFGGDASSVMQCKCDDNNPDENCEYHTMLAVMHPKRRTMFQMMAKQWIENREKREGRYQGDRAMASNDTADAQAQAVSATVEEKKH